MTDTPPWKFKVKHSIDITMSMELEFHHVNIHNDCLEITSRDPDDGDDRISLSIGDMEKLHKALGEYLELQTNVDSTLAKVLTKEEAKELLREGEALRASMRAKFREMERDIK